MEMYNSHNLFDFPKTVADAYEDNTRIKYLPTYVTN
jgi:hypothetical protein